jgi:hypothetical protein
VRTIRLISGVADAASAGIDRLAKFMVTKHAEMAAIDWSDVGRHIVTGLAAGIESAFPSVVSVLTKLADKVKETFGFHLQISSPSKVFERYGEYTAEGFEQGVRQGAPGAAAATRELVGVPAAAGARTGGGGSTRVTHEWHFHVATEAAATAMRQDAGFLGNLTRAVEELNASRGLPIGVDA